MYYPPLGRRSTYPERVRNFLFEQMTGRTLTQAERRSCAVYLFGARWDQVTIEKLEALP